MLPTQTLETIFKKENSDRFSELLKVLDLIIVILDENARVVYINDYGANLLGYKVQEMLGVQWFEIIIPESQRAEVVKTFAQVIRGNLEATEHFKNNIVKKDGTELTIMWRNSYIRDEKNKIIATVSAGDDITNEERLLLKSKVNEARLSSLHEIITYKAAGVQDLLDFALHEVIKLTNSKIGYIYHYFEERKEFVLNTWSKDVMKQCSIEKKPSVYQLDKTGVWGDAVRLRKPIMMNDFDAPNPAKKGYPVGHVPLKKFLTIPLFFGEEIVAVVGVGNKETDYDEEDVKQLQLLMDAVWKIVKIRESEDEMVSKTKELESLNEYMTGRELKMVELKAKIDGLEAKLAKMKKG